MLFRVGNEVS